MKYIGKNISIDIQGESHSNQIELTIKGLKENFKLDFDTVNDDLKRRNPHFSFNTQRKEEDDYEITSGIKNSEVNGDVKVVFKNKSYNSDSYKKHEGFLRPSQSDYASLLKFGEIKPGGGSFSGRMTLPLTFAGSIFKQLLPKETLICSRIKSVYDFEDSKLDLTIVKSLDKAFPMQNSETKAKVIDFLNKTKEDGDSLGGIIETIVFNPPTSLGSSIFDAIESKISSLIFAIPAVKGVEFGDGFDLKNHFGSEVLDKFILSSDKIVTISNHNGGINGGVTNGMPIIIRTIIKPTPTIRKPITSLNYITKKEETVEFEGDHDAFIVNRAIPSIEGMVALALLDELYENQK